MISYIKGEVAKKGLDYIIIENNNIGYYINTSLNTLNMLNENEEAMLHTYMHIREDILALYGFLKTEEIEMFKMLITVNGIGPKAGLAILSTYDVNTIKLIILNEDSAKMCKVPGIGKKTASKIFLELKDKVGSLDVLEVESTMEYNSIVNKSDELSDIIDVLLTLGFNQLEAKKALESIEHKGKSEQDIIKEALKILKR